jgi:hypothetical protein
MFVEIQSKFLLLGRSCYLVLRFGQGNRQGAYQKHANYYWDQSSYVMLGLRGKVLQEIVGSGGDYVVV